MADFFAWWRPCVIEHLSDEELVAAIDQEMPARKLSRAMKHVEVCWQCRARRERLESTILELVDYRDRLVSPLAPPRPGGEERLLARLANEALANAPTPAMKRSRMRLAFSTAALLAIPVAIYLIVIPRTAASAKAIINEADLREKAWLYQPNKVLHWVDETEIAHSPFGLSDGSYRSYHWRNNYAGQGAELTRKYDRQGRLVWAYWRRPDGSDVVFDHSRGDVVKIWPGRQAMQEFARSAAPPVRQRADAWLADREPDSQPNLDWFRRSVANGRVQVLYTADAGKVYRIHLATNPDRDPARWGIDRDYQASTFRMVRLRSRRYLADGTLYSEDDRLVQYNETTPDDFNSHDLRDVMSEGHRTIELSPGDLVKEVKK